MKRFVFILLLVLTLIKVEKGIAQTGKVLKVAVIIPLYADSAFNGNDYKLGMNNLPKYMLPGLDFYNGVMFAIDSLQDEGINLQVNIYDSKSIKQSLSSLISSGELKDINLIIASFNTKLEIKTMADFALDKKIPLISATLPNDGGVKNNPYFVMLNSNLFTHFEQLYKYIQHNHASQNIVLCKKKGNAETILQSYFTDINVNSSVPLTVKTVSLSDTFSNYELLPYLDSTQDNLLVCASLNEAFGLKLVKTMAGIKNTYNTTIVGMPTWDAVKDFDRMTFGNGLNIVYSSPFYFPKKDPLTVNLIQKYRAKFISKPSDMFFKGFENLYHFGKLLSIYDNLTINHLSDNDYKLFNEFKIEGNRNHNDQSLLYLENKKIYVLRRSEKGVESVK